MIRILFLMAGVMALSACGQQHQATYDAGPFQSYVSDFEAKALSQGKQIQINDLVMKFADMTTTTEAGNCDMVEGETPVITINQEDWNAMNEGARTALIFHELGHCILRRVHNPAITDAGLPASVMNPYTLDGSIFLTYEDYYVQELFSVENQF